MRIVLFMKRKCTQRMSFVIKSYTTDSQMYGFSIYNET